VNWSSKLESSEFFGRDVVEPVGMPESSFPSRDMLFVLLVRVFLSRGRCENDYRHPYWYCCDRMLPMISGRKPVCRVSKYRLWGVVRDRRSTFRNAVSGCRRGVNGCRIVPRRRIEVDVWEEVEVCFTRGGGGCEVILKVESRERGGGYEVLLVGNAAVGGGRWAGAGVRRAV
jgi:hypothetical protein